MPALADAGILGERELDHDAASFRNLAWMTI
jgi:hypothetical protein